MKQDNNKPYSGLFGFSNDVCDVWIRILGIDLFIWKESKQYYAESKFAMGCDVGDGLFAIDTPWFMIYPIPDFVYRLFERSK